jgi:hypothetical protein
VENAGQRAVHPARCHRLLLPRHDHGEGRLTFVEPHPCPGRDPLRQPLDQPGEQRRPFRDGSTSADDVDDHHATDRRRPGAVTSTRRSERVRGVMRDAVGVVVAPLPAGGRAAASRDFRLVVGPVRPRAGGLLVESVIAPVVAGRDARCGHRGVSWRRGRSGPPPLQRFAVGVDRAAEFGQRPAPCPVELRKRGCQPALAVAGRGDLRRTHLFRLPHRGWGVGLADVLQPAQRPEQRVDQGLACVEPAGAREVGSDAGHRTICALAVHAQKIIGRTRAGLDANPGTAADSTIAVREVGRTARAHLDTDRRTLACPANHVRRIGRYARARLDADRRSAVSPAIHLREIRRIAETGLDTDRGSASPAIHLRQIRRSA